jgi:hypothetical protein
LDKYRETASYLKESVLKDWDSRTENLKPFIESRWVAYLLRAAWEKAYSKSGIRVALTDMDWQGILLALAEVLDGNLWSQMYLASPLMIFPVYDVRTMATRLEELKTLWKEKPETPFSKGAKLRKASEASATPEDLEWNEALTLTSGLKILSFMPTYTCYKMYDRSQTPAFSDNAGLSRLSCDLNKYIIFPKGDYQVLRLEDLPEFTTIPNNGGMEVMGEDCVDFGITFLSKSGDWENLLGLLAVREGMRRKFLEAQGKVYLIPRHGSLTSYTYF